LKVQELKAESRRQKAKSEKRKAESIKRKERSVVQKTERPEDALLQILKAFRFLLFALSIILL
jgi:hypothetical protein